MFADLYSQPAALQYLQVEPTNAPLPVAVVSPFWRVDANWGFCSHWRSQFNRRSQSHRWRRTDGWYPGDWRYGNYSRDRSHWRHHRVHWWSSSNWRNQIYGWSLETTQSASALPIAEKRLDEPSLLTRLHDLAASDPPLSLKLAKEAVDRFPDNPNAPEFRWNVDKALFNMGQFEEAKDEAQIMLWKYPDNYYTGDVVHHLLNPPPNPSDVAVQGQ